MTDFLEKLKKGMNVEELPEEESSVVLAAAKIKPEKRKKTVNPKIELTPVKEKVQKRKISNGVKKEKTEGEKWFKPARQSFASQNLGGPEGQLTVDVYQTDKEIIIQSAVAGVEPEDLDISIENDMVTIRGNRKKQFEEESQNYFYKECYWGRFSREIILPAEVDNSRAKAIMEKGVLTIRIPKIEREKKRKIVVRE